MKLSIIIVNWNTCKLLEDCLHSIRATADGMELEIIVSDNGSTDGSIELCRREFPEVILIENGRNLGFAAANNRALAVARGEYCLLLNSDTIVLPGALQRSVAYLKAHPSAGGLGCRLITASGEVQRSVETASSLWGSLCHHLHLGRPAHRQASYYDAVHPDVQYVSGAFLMLRREALQRAGHFDEQFFMYAEEADLCLRIRRSGYRIAFTPDAEIVHLGGGSAIAGARSTQRMVSRLRFLRKHRPPLYFELFRALSLVRLALHFLLGRVDQTSFRRLARAHCNLNYSS